MIGAVLSHEELQQRIDALPRQRLAVLPTGIQSLPRLALSAGVSELLIKRDDLTGLGLGGNKTRLLEFILGDALAKGCDVLVAGGGGEQSNHAVQCVAAANRVGMDAVVVLQERPDKRSNGNALLHEVFGGKTIWIDSDPKFSDRTSASERMHEEANQLRLSGRNPYILESSLHPLSVVAYVDAAVELYEQLKAFPANPARVYVTSEGAALGGLVLGSRALGLPWEVIGLDWRPTQDLVIKRLHAAVEAAAEMLGLEDVPAESDFIIHPTGGPAYGVGRTESWAALGDAARMEGLLVDPVYTAKGLAGMLEDLKRRPVGDGDSIVFVHTGGLGAIFAYEGELRRHVINIRSLQ